VPLGFRRPELLQMQLAMATLLTQAVLLSVLFAGFAAATAVEATEVRTTDFQTLLQKYATFETQRSIALSYAASPEADSFPSFLQLSSTTMLRHRLKAKAKLQASVLAPWHAMRFADPAAPGSPSPAAPNAAGGRAGEGGVPGTGTASLIEPCEMCVTVIQKKKKDEIICRAISDPNIQVRHRR